MGKSISIINITISAIIVNSTININNKIFQCRVLSAWADIEIQYVDIIKGNILIKILLQDVC